MQSGLSEDGARVSENETALVITKRGAGYTPYLLGEEDANKIADKSNC